MSTLPTTRPNDAPIAATTPAALTLLVRTTDGKEYQFIQTERATAYRLLESLDLTKTFSNPLLQIGGGTGMTIFQTANVTRIEFAASVTMEAQWPAALMLVREVTTQEAARAQERLRLEHQMGNVPHRDGTAIAELDLTGGEKFTVEIRPDANPGAAELGPRTALDQPLYHNRIFGASGTPIVSATGNIIVLNPAHILRAVIHAPADVRTATLLEMEMI